MCSDCQEEEEEEEEEEGEEKFHYVHTASKRLRQTCHGPVWHKSTNRNLVLVPLDTHGTIRILGKFACCC